MLSPTEISHLKRLHKGGHPYSVTIYDAMHTALRLFALQGAQDMDLLIETYALTPIDPVKSMVHQQCLALLLNPDHLALCITECFSSFVDECAMAEMSLDQLQPGLLKYDDIRIFCARWVDWREGLRIQLEQSRLER